MSHDSAVSSRRLGPLGRFIVYGLLGLCVEIVFTSVMDLAEGTGDLRLRGYSYIWMWPIWGGGVLLCESLGLTLRRKGLGLLGRAGMYMALCFAVEYAAGALLYLTIGRCPWDYSASVFSVHGFIRLDYAPFWALSGVVGESVCAYVRRVRIHTEPTSVTVTVPVPSPVQLLRAPPASPSPPAPVSAERT